MILKGVGLSSMQKDQLHLMVFEAPGIHDFAEDLPRVQSITDSATITSQRQSRQDRKASGLFPVAA